MVMVEQSRLSSECMLIQIFGESSCETCEVKGKRDCGGKSIRATGINEKGIQVPINQKEASNDKD